MSTPFNGRDGLIEVVAVIEGPAGRVEFRVALDTGATHTCLSARRLRLAGCDPGAATSGLEVTTGSGIERMPIVLAPRFSVFDQCRNDFPVLAHEFPPSAGVEGVVGLDFLRDAVVTLDFRAGLITLS